LEATNVVEGIKENKKIEKKSESKVNKRPSMFSIPLSAVRTRLWTIQTTMWRGRPFWISRDGP